jgi:hypothetical protein
VLRRLLALAAALLCLVAVAPTANADSTDDATQVGTYAYLTSPDHDGLAVARSASAGLSIGLGTFDHLDGELVLVGGKLYRVGTDGRPRRVVDDRPAAFFEGAHLDRVQLSGQP